MFNRRSDMHPALQSLAAVTCLAVLVAIGFWFTQERQAHVEANDPHAAFEESIERVKEINRQLGL